MNTISTMNPERTRIQLDSASPNEASTQNHNVPHQRSKTLTEAMGYLGGICLLFNAMTGPSIPFTAQVYSSCGFLLPTFCFLVFSTLATISGLFIIEAMQAIPGNKHFQGTVEFATLANFYFGKKMHLFAQFCLYGALQSNAIQCIVMSAQEALDNILIDVFGRSCAVGLNPFSWFCASESSSFASPFGNTWILFSIGYLVVLALVVPMGVSSLDDNIITQVVSFCISLLIMLQWIIASLLYKSQHTGPEVPIVNANSLATTVGTIMLSVASAYVVPSFVNLRKKDVSIQKTMWSASFLTATLYIAIGIFRKLKSCSAVSFIITPESGGNLLPILSALGQPHMLTKITVYGFPLVMLLPNIPVCFIVSRSNLMQNGIFNKDISTFLSFVLPPLMAIPLLSNPSAMAQFLSYSSLFFVSTSNFIIPIVIYLKCCRFRRAYNKDRGVLTQNQRHLLKLIHFRNKRVVKWVEYKGWSGGLAPSPTRAQEGVSVKSSAGSDRSSPINISVDEQEIMMDDQGHTIGICVPLHQGHFKLLNQTTDTSPWMHPHDSFTYPPVLKRPASSEAGRSIHRRASRRTESKPPSFVDKSSDSGSPCISSLSPSGNKEQAPSYTSQQQFEADASPQKKSDLLSVIPQPTLKSRSSSVRSNASSHSVRFQLPTQEQNLCEEPAMDKGKGRIPLNDTFSSPTPDFLEKNEEETLRSTVPVFSFRVRSPTVDTCAKLENELDGDVKEPDALEIETYSQPLPPVIMVTAVDGNKSLDPNQSVFEPLASPRCDATSDEPLEQIFLETENLVDDETFRNQTFSLRRGIQYIPNNEAASFTSNDRSNQDVNKNSEEQPIPTTFADEPYLIEDVPDPDAEDIIYQEGRRQPRKHVTVYGVYYEEEDNQDPVIVSENRQRFHSTFQSKIKKWESDVARSSERIQMQSTSGLHQDDYHGFSQTIQSVSSLNLMPNSLTLRRPSVGPKSPSVLSIDFQSHSPSAVQAEVMTADALHGDLKLIKSGYSSVLGVPIYSRETHPPRLSAQSKSLPPHGGVSSQDTMTSSALISLFHKTSHHDLRKRAKLVEKKSVESLNVCKNPPAGEFSIPVLHGINFADGSTLDSQICNGQTLPNGIAHDSLHPKAMQTTRSDASSVISFTHLENANPLFYKTMTLPVHPDYVGIAFRTLPRRLTRHIKAPYMAMGALVFTLIITLTSVINLIIQSSR